MHVVRNRVRDPSFPGNTYCKTIKAHKQFSWYYYLSRLMPKDERLWALWVMDEYASNETEMKALRNSFLESYDFYINNEEDITSESKYYMTLAAFRRLMNSGKIEDYNVSEWRGKHIFFNTIEWK